MDNINTGDFLVIGFGNGTQGIKVVGTTAKRLAIIRCQQYLSDSPFWTGTISKISRTDPRIMHAWAVPASIAAAAPSAEAIDAENFRAKHQAALSKLVNKVCGPLADAAWRFQSERTLPKPWAAMNEDERTAWRAPTYKKHEDIAAKRAEIEAAYAAKHGRDANGLPV